MKEQAHTTVSPVVARPPPRADEQSTKVQSAATPPRKNWTAPPLAPLESHCLKSQLATTMGTEQEMPVATLVDSRSSKVQLETVRQKFYNHEEFMLDLQARQGAVKKVESLQPATSLAKSDFNSKKKNQL